VFAFARQVIYNLSHTCDIFCFSYFSDRILHILLGLASDHDPPGQLRLQMCAIIHGLFAEVGSH
jgi:hypothetical protein